MDKANKKDDRVTIRLPEELKRFEAFGFKNISEYIKTALEQFNAKQEYEVMKTQEIIESISYLIQGMEAERDYGVGLSHEKELHLSNLYDAAKALATSDFMVKHPLNQIESPFEDEENGKIYKFNWALS